MFAPYNAGRIKSFMPASKIIKCLFPLFFMNTIFEIRLPELPIINLPGSKNNFTIHSL